MDGNDQSKTINTVKEMESKASHGYSQYFSEHLDGIKANPKNN